MTRTRVLLATLLVVATLSGCTIQDRYEAEPATVGEAALSAAGYQQVAAEKVVRTREDAGGSGRNVTVVSYARAYTRNVSVGERPPQPLAVAVVVSTPSVVAYGTEANPVAEMSPRELLDRFGRRLTDRAAVARLRGVERAGNRTATVLGIETTVALFRATGVTDAGTVSLTIEVTKVRHDDDFVVVAAVYPTRLADDERPRVERLFGGVEH